jgi:thioredoxin 2
MAIVTCPKCGAKNRVDDRAGRMQPVCGRCGTKLDVTAAASTGATDEVIELSDATFEREVKGAGSVPILVDGWAPWCGPCRLIGPIVEQLAAESGGRYRIAKLNVDENPKTAAKFRIESIPTLLIFKNGDLVDRLVGAQPKQVITSHLMARV